MYYNYILDINNNKKKRIKQLKCSSNALKQSPIQYTYIQVPILLYNNVFQFSSVCSALKALRCWLSNSAYYIHYTYNIINIHIHTCKSIPLGKVFRATYVLFMLFGECGMRGGKKSMEGYICMQGGGRPQSIWLMVYACDIYQRG